MKTKKHNWKRWLPLYLMMAPGLIYIFINSLLLGDDKCHSLFFMEKADGLQLMYIIPMEFGKSTKTKLRSSRTGSILDNNVSKSLMPAITY